MEILIFLKSISVLALLITVTKQSLIDRFISKCSYFCFVASSDEPLKASKLCMVKVYTVKYFI